MVWDALRKVETAPQNLDVALSLSPENGGPIGNFGIHDITEYISQTLVNRSALAYPLLVRGNQRIDEGLANKEYDWFRASPAQHHYYLEQARGLGYWLEENILAPDNWNEARRYLEAWWRSEKRPWTRQEIIRDGLDDYMPLAVLGGDPEDHKYGLDPWRAGIEMYEHWLGEPKISFSKTMKPREYGYVVCRHYLNGEFDRADIVAAGHKMLQANLDSAWLEQGQVIRAAIWLMLVNWYPAIYDFEVPPSPVDALQMAYDDMPEVIKPF